MFTVVVADGERVFADALTSLLESDADLRVLPALSSPAELDRVVADKRPDVAIVSSSLGSCNGSTTVPAWAGRGDGTRVLLVGSDSQLEDVTRALQYGASGWLAKDASAAELLRAVRAVARGDVHLPPGLLSSVVRVLAESGQPRNVRDALAGLTNREHEVLGCMVEGLKRDEIATRLFLSPNTVRTHMQNVLRKLDVHSSLAAAAYARRYGVTGVGRNSNHLASAP